jgi:hypothetical protein
MSRESERKRGWSGHRGRKPSSSEAGEGFQGGNRERNERATFDLSPKRLLKYFLGVFIVRDFVGGWKGNLGNEPTLQETCARVIK